MIKFDFYESGELEPEVMDALWDQGVDMDDWDYLLFVPNKFASEFIEVRDGEHSRGNRQSRSYEVEGLLHGCCTNAWYTVEDFKGKKGIVGVAYHS